MSVPFAESVVEDAALGWLQGLGYAVLHGPDLAIGEPGAERSDPDFRDVLLEGRLRAALDYAQVDEIMAGNMHAYLDSIQRQCAQIHIAIHQIYIAYPIDAALVS